MLDLKQVLENFKLWGINPKIGVQDEDENNIIESVDNVIDLNREMNALYQSTNLYMNFDDCFFIGNNGSGDLYFLRVIKGKIDMIDVYIWNHESDSRNWFANNPKDLSARHKESKESGE